MKGEFQDYIKDKNRELYDVILEDLRGGHIELFRLIDGFANQSKWISVETMPERDLIDKLNNCTINVLGLHQGTIFECWFDYDYMQWNSEIIDNLNITHWQLLPEKP